MSLWWAKKDQLDDEQLKMIEQLSLRGNHLVLGPPGSGKTNVLLRRAQYVRSQGMPNVVVLSFTRPLTEFVKTGCYDGQGREIFPRGLVSTVEEWTRGLYKQQGQTLPDTSGKQFHDRKAFLANQAVILATTGRVPRLDAIFVDEAQDLLAEEVTLLCAWSPTIFFVGDDRQRIYDGTRGLEVVRRRVSALNETSLRFHYRLAPELCEMADRIQILDSGATLSATSHYKGPRPGRAVANGPLGRVAQVQLAAERVKSQLRVYHDLIVEGDLIGIVVPRREDREFVFNALESDPDLSGKVQIIRARTGESDDRDYNPSFDSQCPVAILTEKGCKGLEFRAAHWLFCDDLQHYRTTETYYTIATRAKTSLDLYHGKDLPMTLAKSCSPPGQADW